MGDGCCLGHWRVILKVSMHVACVPSISPLHAKGPCSLTGACCTAHPYVSFTLPSFLHIPAIADHVRVVQRTAHASQGWDLESSHHGRECKAISLSRLDLLVFMGLSCVGVVPPRPHLRPEGVAGQQVIVGAREGGDLPVQ